LTQPQLCLLLFDMLKSTPSVGHVFLIALWIQPPGYCPKYAILLQWKPLTSYTSHCALLPRKRRRRTMVAQQRQWGKWDTSSMPESPKSCPRLRKIQLTLNRNRPPPSDKITKIIWWGSITPIPHFSCLTRTLGITSNYVGNRWSVHFPMLHWLCFHMDWRFLIVTGGQCEVDE